MGGVGPGRRSRRCFVGRGLWMDRSSALQCTQPMQLPLLWCGWYLVPLATMLPSNTST